MTSRNRTVSYSTLRIWGMGAISAIAAFLSTLLFAPFRQTDQMIDDLLVSFAAPSRAVSKEILVVAITQQDIDSFDFISPIDRNFLSDLLTAIDSKAPKTITFDILLDRKTSDDADKRLAQALMTARAPIIIAVSPDTHSSEACELDSRSSDTIDILPTFAKYVQQGDARLCETNGVVRNTVIEHSSSPISTLANATANAGRVVDSRLPANLAQPLEFQLTKTGKYPYLIVPASIVPELPQSLFEKKYVLVATIADNQDWFSTPLRFSKPILDGIYSRGNWNENKTPGVLIHAYALERALRSRNNSLGQSGIFLGSISMLLSATAAIYFGSADFGWRLKTLALLLTLAAAVTATIFVFSNFGVALPVLGLVISSVAGFGAVTTLLESKRRIERNFIKGAFDRYLAPEFVSQIIEDPTLLSPHAKSAEISVLFTDIESFCEFVERSDPEVVQKILNQYFSIACEIVRKHGGTIDKIVGDALHVLFSAPIEMADHKDRALLCGLELNEALERLRTEHQNGGIIYGRTRIGIHSGIAYVGNFGGSLRYDYTAHGSVINLASRLEALNKLTGTQICTTISESASPDAIALLPIATFVVRGFDQQICVYCPVRRSFESDSYIDEYCKATAAILTLSLICQIAPMRFRSWSCFNDRAFLSGAFHSPSSLNCKFCYGSLDAR
ncbi:MAG: adenylate/guanylate cyclase domain-containing protein [Parvularculaceae bacterium]